MLHTYPVTGLISCIDRKREGIYHGKV
uniref:Uncharacterized protein n=1 Tax=Anguilla anguilla TaxID=7936 RepID=A0A0E9RNI7_ANGAN